MFGRSFKSTDCLKKNGLCLTFFFSLQKLGAEARGLEGKQKDVNVLSGNVGKYLGGISGTAKGEVQEQVTGLNEKYKR